MQFTRSNNSELSSANWVVLSLTARGNNGENFSHKGNKPPEREAKTFLVKSVFKSDRYVVLITDLQRVWFEELREREIIKRAKDVGSGLDASEEIQVPNLLTLLTGLLETQKNGVTYEFEIVKNALKLKTLTDLGLATLRWVFFCEVIPVSPPSMISDDILDGPAILYKHLTLPMMNVMLGYMKQVDELIRIVKDKENETLDAVEGKTSTRKRKTEQFDEDKFEETMRKKIALQVDHANKKELDPIFEIFADTKTRTLLKEVTESATSKPGMEDDPSQLTDLGSCLSNPRKETPEAPPNSQSSCIDFDSSPSTILDEDISSWQLVDSRSLGASPNANGAVTSSSEPEYPKKEVDENAKNQETIPMRKELEKRQQIKDNQKKYEEGLKKRKKKVW